EGNAMGMKGVLGELGQNGALKRVDEADTENITSDLGDLGIGRGGRNHRYARGFADGSGLERAAGGDLPEDGHDLVAGDELAHGGGGLARLGLVVFGDEVDFPAEHAAGGVDFLNGEDRALVGRLTKGGLLAGERGIFADFDLVGAAGEGEGGKEEGKSGFSHQGWAHGRGVMWSRESVSSKGGGGRAGNQTMWISTV